MNLTLGKIIIFRRISLLKGRERVKVNKYSQLEVVRVLASSEWMNSDVREGLIVFKTPDTFFESPNIVKITNVTELRLLLVNNPNTNILHNTQSELN